jgi:hypothetical protein
MKKPGSLSLSSALVGATIMGGVVSTEADAHMIAKFIHRYAHKLEDRIIGNEKPINISNHAIVMSQRNLAQMGSPDVYVKLTRDDLKKIQPLLIAKLKASPELKGQGLTILDSSDIEFSSQALSLNLNAEYEHESISAKMLIKVNLAISSEDSRVAVDPYLTEIKIDDLELGDFNVDRALPLMNGALKLVKNILSFEMRSRLGPITKNLALPTLRATNLQQFSTEKLEFQERPLKYFPTLERIAFLVNEGGLYGIADVTNLDAVPQAQTANPPAVTYDPVTEDQRDAAFAAYSHSFNMAMQQHAGLTVDSPYTVAVSKDYLSGSLNKILSTDPIAGSVHLKSKESYHADVTLGGKVDLSCQENFQACAYQDVCKSPTPCTEVLAPPINELIKACVITTCASTGGIGCVIHKVKEKIEDGCRKLHQAAKPVFRALNTPICVEFFAVQKVVPGVCSIAKNVAKAECDVRRAINVAGCEGEQTFRNTLADVKVGNINGDYALDGLANLSLSNINVTPDFHSLTGTVSGKGNARADATFNFSLDGKRFGELSCITTALAAGGDVSTTLDNAGVALNLVDEKITDRGLNYRYEIKHDLDVRLAQSPVTIFRDTVNSAQIKCDKVGVPLSLLGINIPLSAPLAAVEALTKDRVKISHEIKAGFNLQIPNIRMALGKEAFLLRPRSEPKVFSFARVP